MLCSFIYADMHVTENREKLKCVAKELASWVAAVWCDLLQLMPCLVQLLRNLVNLTVVLLLSFPQSLNTHGSEYFISSISEVHI